MASGLPASETEAPVAIVNADGTSPFVFVCDHASNHMPSSYDDLGLSEADRLAHIAWDPGALGVSLNLSTLLNAPLVHSTVSRLIVDCNRDESAPDLVPEISELTEIPGNRNLQANERAERLALAHRPFHDAIDGLLDAREGLGFDSVVVSIHTYTPVHKGITRPWEIGLISNTDRRLADPALALLREKTSYQVGDNEPYSPDDGVYYTLQRHGEDRGLMCLMIEVRNDEVATPEAERQWAALLADILSEALDRAALQTAGGANA